MKTTCKLLPYRLLIAFLLALPAVVPAQTFTNSYGIWSYAGNGNGTCTITAYSGASTAVTIPATINGLSVTTIGDGSDSVFVRTEVAGVTMGTNVTCIATAAFSYSTSLVNVTIPNSITSIGPGADNIGYDIPGAFEGCTSLNSVIIPNSLTEIPDVTFSGCTGLANVIIGTNVTSIGYEAFYGCGLTNLMLPNSVTSIGGGGDVVGAFENCAQLTSITLPNRLTSIGDLVFLGCASLTSITIPNNITGIGDGTFAGCTSLTNVMFGTNLTTIGSGATGEGAFEGCISLTSITIPASDVYIAQLAFAGCSGLTSVFFAGNAPGWINSSDDQFENDTNAVGYYLPGTSGWGTVIYSTLPTELWLPGSLQVAIAPAAVVNAGAQWQVDGGGTWQDSGALVSGLSQGNHTVSFSAINGWQTPPNQIVYVSTNLFAIAAAVGVYVAIPPPPSPLTTLHSFSATPASAPYINGDGAQPYAGLVLSGNTLYGTTQYGGNSGVGTVFAISTNGSSFTNLHSFTGGGGDGALPYAGLVLSGNTLYGTTYEGGGNFNGTVFAIHTDGTGFTNLYSFSAKPANPPWANSDGAYPYGGLIISGNTLYGTASYGGSYGVGTVFAVHTDGTGFTNLHSFFSSTDGETPESSLLLLGNTLYGAAHAGGSGGAGTVFAVSTTSTGFINLHNFKGLSYMSSTNTDGALPWAGLIVVGNTLYGTTLCGGTNGIGTVFAINTNGTGFNTVYSFDNSSGGEPTDGLLVQGDTFYGTARDGGSAGNGSVFTIKTNGTGYANLYSFTPEVYRTNSDGINPWGGLVLAGGTFYGTAWLGGGSGNGTVFSLTVAVPLAVTTLSLPNATIDTAYSQQLNAGGGRPPYAWTMNSGALPPGLNLSPGGAITGVPTNSGTFSFTVLVTDATNNTATQALNLQVDDAITAPLVGMSLIPAGSFVMGDTADGGKWSSYEIPIHTNFVSALYMDTNLVSYSLWQSVYDWAVANGYGFDDAGSGKAATHPVQTVDWYDVVKWCNARSEQAGLTPVYYTDGTHATVYRNGDIDLTNGCANWNASGYRLPTEAEWEKAARGGLYGKRYPLTNTISESQADYYSTNSESSEGDLSNTGWNPAYNNGGYPYTSPVGSFAPNGYGLYDMAGNVFEWCWDWSTNYSRAPQSDPRGPDAGNPSNYARAIRGGCWNIEADGCRVAFRGEGVGGGPSEAYYNLGFRCVLHPDVAALQITTTSLPSGTNHMAYAQTLAAAGGQAPFSWTNITGALPPGLTIATNGVISGTPTTNGTFTFTARVTDALSETATQALALYIVYFDTIPPVLTITAPTSGQRWSNVAFTVTGTATDNVAVASVAYSLNGGGWGTAAGTKNWSAALTLTPGTNTVAAYAADTSGNLSTTSSVSFQYVVTNQLGVRIAGLGAVSPNKYNNGWLNLGQNYSITSAPATGFVFTNWTVSTNWVGNLTVTGTNLHFMMASNLTLLATFVETSRPTLTITAPANNHHMTNAVATVTGTNSDNWGIASVWYQVNSNAWNQVGPTTNSYTNWTQLVTLVTGTNTVKAYAVNLGGKYSPTNSVSLVSSNTFKLQLAFTNAVPLKANGLTFSLQLSAGLDGHIQYSTNLTSWTTLTNFIGTNATITFHDPAATNSSHRYYRAVIP